MVNKSVVVRYGVRYLVWCGQSFHGIVWVETYVVPVTVNCSYSTPDYGYGKYPKRVEWSCNKIEILVLHLVGRFVCIYLEKDARSHEPEVHPLFMSDINKTWFFIVTLSKHTQMSDSVKIRPLGVGLFHADLRTDRHEVKCRSPQFCERAYKPNSDSRPDSYCPVLLLEF
jgi:hypothetical protein